MEKLRSLFKRHRTSVPEAEEVLRLSKVIIDRSAQHLTHTDDKFLINGQQCILLVRRLSETQRTLEDVEQSSLLDEKTIPVLKGLHKVLLDVETLIGDCCIISRQSRLRSVIEQGDKKELFSRLLYDVQWYTNVLLSILVSSSEEACRAFEPSMCDGKLSVGDEFALLTAAKIDEEILKDILRSWKLDDPTEQRLANQLLEKLEAKDQSLMVVEEDSGGFSLLTSSLFLWVDPQDLDLDGKVIGRGASAEVRQTSWLGGKYAMKIFDTALHIKAFDQEISALEGLKRHPHIVSLFGYSRSSAECFLVMEEMHKDLFTLLRNHRQRNNYKPSRPFSTVQAVDLMLQIAEGVRYIHSKGMAHRDLKSLNVLLNLADPSSRSISSITSVKIADFGLTKTKNASQTHTNQTFNTGTTKWMAPEVIGRVDDADKSSSRFNPRKIDVYSFAIVCSEILTGEDPYGGGLQSAGPLYERVKSGARPNLPVDCPTKLASLITRCWDGVPHRRPSFPEICIELRYIKGLLLRDDQKSLKTQNVLQFEMEGAQVEGPWGGDGGNKFFDVATSIKRIKLKYDNSPGMVGLFELEYDFNGTKFIRKHCDGYNGNETAEITFEPFEFITQVSGFVSTRELMSAGAIFNITNVVSLTIHTNINKYGPYGEEGGDQFTTSIGRVIGFHGGGGAVLDSVGVVIAPGVDSDFGDRNFK